MASSADAFLNDLDDLGDLGEFYQPQQQPLLEDDFSDFEDSDDMDVDGQLANRSTDVTPDPTIAGGDETLSTLLKNSEFMESVQEIQKRADEGVEEDAQTRFSENDPEYTLVVKCNRLMRQIDEELMILFDKVRSIYITKFPQLHTFLQDPMTYLRVVKEIGEETNLSKINFSNILDSQSVMSLTITATHSKTEPLEPKELARALTGCQEAFTLSDYKDDMLRFLEARMSIFCPNLTALLSAALAAKLVPAAGGLQSLAQMPAQNIPLIGTVKRSMQGMAGHSDFGILYASDLIYHERIEYKKRAVRLVAGKAAIAARCDFHRTDINGQKGAKLREEIQEALVKAAAPQQAKQKKPLPKPDDVPSKKRGGRQHRRLKERYQQTDFQKQAGRMKFGEEGETEIDQEHMHFGQAMVGVTSTKGGRGEHIGNLGGGFTKDALGKVQKQREKQREQEAAKRQRLAAAAGQRESGVSSSLAFTSVTGIELVNPDGPTNKPKTGGRYFGEDAEFLAMGNK